MTEMDKNHVGSFADGSQTTGHDHEMGHFSEGQEQDHGAAGGHMGSFSEGDLARHEAHQQPGSFADTDCPVCRAMATA